MSINDHICISFVDTSSELLEVVQDIEWYGGQVGAAR